MDKRRRSYRFWAVGAVGAAACLLVGMTLMSVQMQPVALQRERSGAAVAASSVQRDRAAADRRPSRTGGRGCTSGGRNTGSRSTSMIPNSSTFRLGAPVSVAFRTSPTPFGSIAVMRDGSILQPSGEGLGQQAAGGQSLGRLTRRSQGGPGRR